MLSRLRAVFFLGCLGALLFGCEAGGELGEAPDQPQLSGQPGDGSVTLDWPDDPRAKLYNVYWSPADNVSDAVQRFGIRNTSATSNFQCQDFNGVNTCMQTVNESRFELTGLTNNVAYYFTAVAIGDAGQSLPSIEITLVPRAAPPSPANLQVKLGFTDVLLSWDAVTDLPSVSYRVYVADSAEALSSADPINSDDTSMQLTDIEFGKEYFFAVSTIDNATLLEGSLSDISQATTFRRPQLALGESHTCAINESKDLYCTGANNYGQLGTNVSGWSQGKTVYTALTGAAGKNWDMVVAGAYYTCAIDENAELYCWGDNIAGPLGTGSPEDVVALPTRITSDVGWLWIAARTTHMCGIKLDHTLWCWGRNNRGELGLGIDTTLYESRPMQIGSGEDWLSVAVGDQFTCALKIDHSLWCWGSNTKGELGNPEIAPFIDTPIQIAAGDQWLMLATGLYFTCATKLDLTMWCWGANNQGQLGDLTVDTKLLPNPVFGIQEWQWLATGDTHVCAIDNLQTLWCWGDNWGGQMGNGRFVDVIEPQAVDDILSYTTVAAGSYHTCALQTNNTLWCWGYNLYGQLGNGSNELSTHEFYYSPQQSGLKVADWSSIDVRYGHACGIRTGGTMWCWGANYAGQLGRGNYEESSTPVLIKHHFNWKEVSTGENNTCAIKTDGRLFCWGSNLRGQIGNGRSFSGGMTGPSYVESDTAWISVTSGEYFTCGLKSDNSAWCWGDNRQGQLGNGASDVEGLADELLPVQLQQPLQWNTIKAGGNHSCGIAADDKIYCWGGNVSGQLGVGYYTPQRQVWPTQIADDNTWKKLDVNDDHSCAIRFDDTLWCWGLNSSGELGTGDYASRNAPTLVSSSELFKEINLGAWSGCATTLDDRILCWGWDIYGLVTEGGASSSVPQQMFADFSPVKILSGADSGCLLNPDSTVWCFGGNYYGQIGDGSAWSIFPETIALPQ